jgi:membrane-bound lytic murein transglycosylase MltF
VQRRGVRIKRRSLGQLKIDRSVKAKAVQQAIYKEAARYNIDPNFVVAIVWQESRFRPDAVSEKNARGLMPLMPETAGKVQCSEILTIHTSRSAGCGVSRVVAGQVSKGMWRWRSQRTMRDQDQSKLIGTV